MPYATVNGASIYYVSQGNAGVPVVFVHGAGGSHLIWWHQVRALQGMARAVAIDLPGHGKSDPPGRTSVDAYAGAVAGLLDALALERAVIVGHSMGGAIAQTLALTHPDRVAGLGLVGTGARLRVLPAILDGIVVPDQFEATVRLIVDNSYVALDPLMRQRAEAELAACSPQVTHDDFAACNAFDVMPRLGEIGVPTLVVCGRQDRMTPVKYSEFLAAHIARARLTLVDDAGHYVMIEKPAPVSDALAGFIPLVHA